MAIISEIINEVIPYLLEWQVWVYVSLGVLLGLTLGAIPGMTGGIGIGLALPFTMWMPPVHSIALLIGIYKASMFGGSISAICFAAPGTPAAAADVPDGYSLTKQGKSRKAIQIGLYSSTTADTLSDITLMVVVIPLAMVALQFGSREMLALMILALVTIIMFVRQQPLKGISTAMIGFIIGVIGADPMSAVRRFTFGTYELAGGVSLIPFVLGLFALSEIFVQTSILLQRRREQLPAQKFKLSKENLTFKEYISCWKEMLIGWIIGTFLGALPGPGSTLAAYTSHAVGGKISNNKENFGKGALEGLAAAEAGNSATAGATFVPLFAFGIPGSAMAGLFMGAFMMQGITPGPTMFVEHREIMYTILIVLIIANIFNLAIGRLLSAAYAYIASLSRAILLPFLGVLACVGTYAYQTRPFDVVLVVLIGLIGYVMRVYDYPLPPMLIGFILAPMIERNFRRMVTIDSDPLFFFQSPIAVGLLLAAIAIAVIFTITGTKDKMKKTEKGELDK